MRYSSVAASGVIEPVETRAEKLHALELITLPFSEDAALDIPEIMLERTTILKMRVDFISGKQNSPKKQGGA